MQIYLYSEKEWSVEVSYTDIHVLRELQSIVMWCFDTTSLFLNLKFKGSKSFIATLHHIEFFYWFNVSGCQRQHFIQIEVSAIILYMSGTNMMPWNQFKHVSNGLNTLLRFAPCTAFYMISKLQMRSSGWYVDNVMLRSNHSLTATEPQPDQ